jgi:hypothetical protein
MDRLMRDAPLRARLAARACALAESYDWNLVRAPDVRLPGERGDWSACAS